MTDKRKYWQCTLLRGSAKPQPAKGKVKSRLCIVTFIRHERKRWKTI